jgi:hypothetical protein
MCDARTELASQRITVSCVVPGRIEAIRANADGPGRPHPRPAFQALSLPRKWQRW